MKAVFRWYPHRGVWMHDPTGACITHWSADSDMAKIIASAKAAVVVAASRHLGKTLTADEVEIDFDARSFASAPEPIPQPVIR